MSANLNNPAFELSGRIRQSTLAGTLVPPRNHEALQALLAFSALHEQIRQRKAAAQFADANVGVDNPWEVEQFVLDEVLLLVAERALAITGADGVAIALAEGDSILCRASAGPIAPEVGARLDPRSGFSGACLSGGQIVRCDDSDEDARVNREACRRLGIRSMVAVPLSARQHIIGLVEAFSTDAFGFNDSDVRSLSLLSELILAALKPEEEDRLAEIARRVVPKPVVGRAETKEVERAIEVISPLPTASVSTREKQVAPQPTSAVVATPAVEEEFEEAATNGSKLWLWIMIAVLLLGAAAGEVWWRTQHKTAPTVVVAQPTVTEPAAAPAIAAEPVITPTAPIATEVAAAKPTPAPLAPGATPQITGFHHATLANSSQVVIDLQDQVQYEAHRLTAPDRIYFDFDDTALAPGLAGKTIEVGDALLVRMRAAQPQPGTTRVVLETKGTAEFSVSLKANPYRLVVEVHKPGTRAEAPASPVVVPPPATAKALPPASQDALRLTPKEDTRLSAQVPKLRIVLDAGHGGWDLGTVGRKGLLEKDLVLDIVARLGELVSKRMGAEVIYTREDDNYIPLEKRTEVANAAQADFFMSVHANYSDLPSARGVETYYTNTFKSANAGLENGGTLQNTSWENVDIHEKTEGSRRLAATVQRSLYDTLAVKNPGLRNRGVKEASYVVLTGTTMPAVLAEVSFVSSPSDETKLQSSAYRQQIAEALYKGIARYGVELHRVKIASVAVHPMNR